MNWAHFIFSFFPFHSPKFIVVSLSLCPLANLFDSVIDLFASEIKGTWQGVTNANDWLWLYSIIVYRPFLYELN